MNSTTKHAHLLTALRGYMKHMSKEAAIKKLKRTHLGRLDYIIDEIAEHA